jgi:pimeloyl-ACP methyl ester carboxylesterase
VLKLPVNGMRLAVRVEGRGRPIVLLHGWLGTSYHWRHLIPRLTDRFQIIAPDMRGYGESDKPYTGYDGETLADDVEQLLAQLGVERPIIVGHDMGALPALLLAARPSVQASGLVYVDEPLPGYNLDRFTAFSKDNPFIYWWFAFNSQAHLPAQLWQDREPALVDYFLTAMAADPASITEADKAEYVRGLRKPGGLHGSFGWYRDALVTGEQIRAATAIRLQLPVLALNGEYGHPGVEEQMRLVADDVTGETFPRCGHLCAEEQPEAFAQAIHRFAERVWALEPRT